MAPDDEAARCPAPDVPGILPRWLVKLCRPSRMVWLAPLLAFVLTLPSLFSGYVQDDHNHRQQALERSVYARRPAWDHFNWVSSNAEVVRYRERSVACVGWWTPDSARTRFVRPVASLFHAAELHAFGDSPWAMHLSLALLYALITWLAVKLLQRFSSTPTAFAIGALLFAIDDVHAYSAGWISAANTLLTFAFGLVALLGHDRWRRERSRAGLALSLTAFVLSLLSSEGALALMGYLGAYALFLDEGRWRRRVASLVPATLIALGYAAWYVTQGLGIRGSFDYLSPFDDPVQTVLSMLSGLLTGTLSQLLSVGPLSMALQPLGGTGVLVAAGLLAGLVALLWRFLGSSKRVAFFGTSLVLSILPFTVGMMGDRYLLWASLGAAGLLGELFAVFDLRSRLQRFAAKTLLVTNAALSLLLFVPTLFWLAAIEQSIRRLEQLMPSEDTVVLNSNLIAMMATASLRYERGGEWPEHVYTLYDGTDTLSVARTGDRTLRATTARGWFASSLFTERRRPKELRFEPRQTIELELMTATVERVTADGRPLTVRFDFKKDLADLAWIKMTPRGHERLEVPAVGEELRVSVWPWDD